MGYGCRLPMAQCQVMAAGPTRVVTIGSETHSIRFESPPMTPVTDTLISWSHSHNFTRLVNAPLEALDDEL